MEITPSVVKSIIKLHHLKIDSIFETKANLKVKVKKKSKNFQT
jgi:hypothetical protein